MSGGVVLILNAAPSHDGDAGTGARTSTLAGKVSVDLILLF